MGIIFYVGNVGSGKTVCAVRDMYKNDFLKTYSNIKTKGLKNSVSFTPDMIIKKTEDKIIKKRDTGKKEIIYKYSLNLDYWKDIKEPINVVIDEAHTILNSRKSSSKINTIMTDYIALIRRVLGQSQSGYGDLVLISQLSGRVDVIAREMAHQIRYHVCHYRKRCNNCGTNWNENSEMPEPIRRCPTCNDHRLRKYNHIIEVWHFAGMSSYDSWKLYGEQSFYKHYLVRDIEKYFPFYSTLQWDNMFSEFY